ncbi:hypothetical protein [Lysobacter gummosus]|uniref:hypothetical protein n=1 Tax=Lysobacter gummosus TaxID=262324 RepID=UPI00363D3F97
MEHCRGRRAWRIFPCFREILCPFGESPAIGRWVKAGEMRVCGRMNDVSKIHRGACAAR